MGALFLGFGLPVASPDFWAWPDYPHHFDANQNPGGRLGGIGGRIG
jgi:hypothetical protein